MSRKSSGCQFEPLEDRRLLSASLSVAQSMMVFNDVKGAGASYTETLALTDNGDAALTLGSSNFAIVNDPTFATQDAARFSIVNAASIPATLSPGQTFNLQLNYNATAIGINSAFLNITSNDPNNPLLKVALRGIGTTGLGGVNQPSLTRILQAYEIPINVGEAANALTYPAFPDASSQEVVLQQLEKAGAGPVTIQVLASFDASGTKPYTLGTYPAGNPTDRSELFFTPSSEYQSTYIQPQGATTFDPGSSPFGFYFVSNIKDNGINRIGTSEDQFNTWDATPTTQASNPQRKFRFFPLENSDGSVVPNAYIMTSTEWQNPGGYDFTNVVAIVRNVMAVPGISASPLIGLQNSNALPGSDTMIFNRIQTPNPTLGDHVHDTGVLTVSNTGQSPLIISSYTLSDAWTLLSYPALASLSFPLSIAAGQSVQLAVKFVAQTRPTHPYNETQSAKFPNDGGVYNGSLVLNSNDPHSPTTTVPLAGYWQARSEDDTEPSLQTIVNLMAGWTTNINPTPIPDLTENIAIPSTSTYYGEEVVSSYWSAADPSQQVGITQLAAYHTEGNTTVTNWFAQGGSTHNLFTTATDDGQTLFPNLYGTTTPAATQFTPSSVFGFKIDSEYSDDSKNTQTGGGHHVRFYPVRDSNGLIVANTYIMSMDYTLVPGENFDFQDNIYIVSNIRPATTAPVPTDLYANNSQSNPAAVQLQWAPVTYSGLVGYNIYRSVASSGGFQLLNSAPVNAISYLDTNAPSGTKLYYKVTAVGSSTTTESFSLMTSVTTPGTPVFGLQSADINASPAGSTTTITAGSAYDVVAGGPGVGGNADAFRYLFQTQTGDFDVEVQVQSLTVAGAYSTAGIMARTTLDAASPNVYMAASPVNFKFKDRTTTAATAAIAQAGTPKYPNVWVRLTRVGNLFTGYYSTNATTWTKMSSITMNVPSTIFLGLAVASNTSNTTTTAQLRNYQSTASIPVQPTIPPTPSNFTATGVQGGVSLNWSAVTYANLKGYNVYSSSSATGTYALLTSSPTTSTSYLDSSAVIGATTFYRVTAVDSTTSTESSAATASGIAQAISPVQTGMQSIDINPSMPGSTTVITANTDFNVTASGPGVGGTADAFRFIYQSQTGDFDVQVQVTSITVAGNFSTAGIMARSTLDPASPDVYMSASPVNYRFKDRTTVGATAAVATAGATAYPHVWVRLTRVGNVFTGYYSANGKTWTKMSSITLALPTTIDLGLGVASNTNDTTTTAQLRGFGPTPVAPPVMTAVPTPTNLIATGNTASVTLNWTAVTYANLKGYNVYRSSSSTGTYTLLTSTTATSYVDTTAPAGEIMYYKVTAVDATTSTESTAATAHASAALTTALTSSAIGTPAPGTVTTITPGADYNVTAGGPGVGANSDNFQFIGAQQTGDFDVKVQVSSLTVAGNFSTAGIMARATMDATSQMAYISASPVNYRFKDRTTIGSTAAIASTGTTSYPNVWVRLSRIGNVFTGYTSTDGIHWTVMSTVTIALPTTIYLGLGVASNDTTDLATAQLRGYSNT
jgi:fibronectin type 3 domain-containing protein/regulation of enolase protein 1 (concanavalin A-like superfamily)